MDILKRSDQALGKLFIKDFDNTADLKVRTSHGLLAGWTSIIVSLVLFIVKIAMSLESGSVSIVADAFHLLSHLANSVILVLTFAITSRPATAATPFGHGRMEHIAPLVMSIFIFISGIEIAERSIHQALHPREVHFWPALPWILMATVAAKYWMEHFAGYLGDRVDSRAIMASARHQKIEALSTILVIAGLLSGHYLGFVRADGYLGLVLSIWLLYLGYRHARHAVVPLLGQAPDRELINRIRETAGSVEGISDVHEIIVHDYGSMYLISLHGEIPENYGPAGIHEIAERCEYKLRQQFGGEAVCHSDPLPEKTAEFEIIEEKFRKVVAGDSRIAGYHDFRIVSASETRIVIVADIHVKEEVPVAEFPEISKDLEARTKKDINKLAYCSFYITPKFAY